MPCKKKRERKKINKSTPFSINYIYIHIVINKLGRTDEKIYKKREVRDVRVAFRGGRIAGALKSIIEQIISLQNRVRKETV